MTEYVWSTMRDDVIAHCGDTPSAAIEQRILDVFEHHPRLVLHAIAHVVARWDQGVVRSVWPVLAKHVEEAATSDARASKTVSDKGDRVKAREQGAAWIKSSGLYFDRESDVDDELFGSVELDDDGEPLLDESGKQRRFGGLLRAFADDAELRDELLTLWATERPRGERAERESEERQRRQGEHYRRSHELQRARAHHKLDDVAPETQALVGAHLPNPFMDA